MVPTRLVSARTRTVFEGVLRWAPSTWAVLRPSQLLPLQASCRLLSVGIVDCAKHREPSGKKLLSEKKLKRHFVDHRRVLVRGGSGGSGMSCFHSEPRKEFGGPDGGDGGNGGHIILRVDQQVKSLSSVSSQYQGFNGEDGGSKNCSGRGGATLYIQVPVGTLVKEGDEIVADLSNLGDEYMAALGGAGGKGNRFFLANDNRAPVTCTPGQPGQERVLYLELKTMAHAGMVRPDCATPWGIGFLRVGTLLPRRKCWLSFTPPAQCSVCASCWCLCEITGHFYCVPRLASRMLGNPLFFEPSQMRSPLSLPTRSPP